MQRFSRLKRKNHEVLHNAYALCSSVFQGKLFGRQVIFNFFNRYFQVRCEACLVQSLVPGPGAASSCCGRCRLAHPTQVICILNLKTDRIGKCCLIISRHPLQPEAEGGGGGITPHIRPCVWVPMGYRREFLQVVQKLTL